MPALDLNSSPAKCEMVATPKDASDSLSGLAFAAAIEHDHGLAQTRLELAGNDAPDDVASSARRIGHNQLQRFFGVTALCRCDRRATHHAGRRQRGRQKHSYHVEQVSCLPCSPAIRAGAFRRQPSRIDGTGSLESTARSTPLL